MTKSLNLIAALAAFFAYAGTAVADGDYHAGASRHADIGRALERQDGWSRTGGDPYANL